MAGGNDSEPSRIMNESLMITPPPEYLFNAAIFKYLTDIIYFFNLHNACNDITMLFVAFIL